MYGIELGLPSARRALGHIKAPIWGRENRVVVSVAARRRQRPSARLPPQQPVLANLAEASALLPSNTTSAPPASPISEWKP